MDAHGGERRKGKSRGGDIVNADKRNILWDVQTTFMNRPQYADSNGIGSNKQCLRIVFPRQHLFCQFITRRTGKTAAPDILFAYHLFQSAIFRKGDLTNIRLARLIFTANKTNTINALVDIEVDDFFTDACQIDIHRIVTAAGFVKVDKTDIVGQRAGSGAQGGRGFADN